MNYGKLDKKFYKVAFENLDLDLGSISLYLKFIDFKYNFKSKNFRSLKFLVDFSNPNP